MRITRITACSFALLLGITWGLGAQAQSTPAACLRAVYQLDYRLDSAVAMPTRVQMILRVSNGFSRFQSTSRYFLDSVYMSLRDAPEQERLQKSLDATRKGGRNKLSYTILKEPAKNLVAYHDNIITGDYQYQEKAPVFSWKVTSAKKNIAGYECQQAYTRFGGRTWEAWFAHDVPVSDGPYKFYGLPGLIMQVRDTQDHYVFSLLCLDTNPQPFNAAADSGAPLSSSSSAPVLAKAKFLRAKLNDELTFMDRMLASGNRIPESMQQEYFAELKRRNNPLERR